MSDRPTISEVTVTFEGGKTVTYLPSEVSALFLDWDKMEKILIPFYEKANHKMTKLQAEKEFGKKTADAVFGSDPGPKKIDTTFIETVWNTENDSGTLPALLTKRPECILGAD